MKRKAKDEGSLKRKVSRTMRRLQHLYDADILAGRAALSALIAACDIDGTMAVLSSGMDCDGAAWRNRLVGVIPATLTHYRAFRDALHNEAEGPLTVWPCRIPEVPPPSPSRDLTLEAFENGHPYRLEA